ARQPWVSVPTNSLEPQRSDTGDVVSPRWGSMFFASRTQGLRPGLLSVAPSGLGSVRADLDAVEQATVAEGRAERVLGQLLHVVAGDAPGDDHLRVTDGYHEPAELRERTGGQDLARFGQMCRAGVHRIRSFGMSISGKRTEVPRWNRQSAARPPEVD